MNQRLTEKGWRVYSVDSLTGGRELVSLSCDHHLSGGGIASRGFLGPVSIVTEAGRFKLGEVVTLSATATA